MQGRNVCLSLVKVKPVVPREQASRDVDDAVAYYLDEGSASVALDFIDALEQSLNPHRPPPWYELTSLWP